MSWRHDARWEHHANSFKIEWTVCEAAQQNRPKASEYLHNLLAIESSLGVRQRTLLHHYLAVFHFAGRDLHAAASSLDDADLLWPQSRTGRQLRELIFPVQEAAFSGEEQTGIPALIRGARSKFYRGDVDGAVKDFLTAIKLNPGDAGADYAIETDSSISPEAQEHGETQVRAMLRDRPGMAQYIEPGDPLWKWAVAKFAGVGTDQLVDWNPGDPSPFDACCRPATNGRHAEIQVRSLESSAPSAQRFEQYWSDAAFELHNVSHGAGSSLNIDQKASEGEYSRDAFIVAMLDQEKVATECTRVFYLKFFLPYMQAKKLSTNPATWSCYSFFPDEATRLRCYRTLDHWEHFGRYYDDLIKYRRDVELYRAHQLQKRGELDEASAIMKKLITTHGAWSEGLYVRGVIAFKRGQYEDSLQDFNQGLELEPSHFGNHYYRGQAFAELGKWKEALDDFTTLVRTSPNQPHGYYGRAKVQLGSVPDRERNIASAVEDARRACELTSWKSAEHLELLKKAYSATGDSKQAQSIEKKLRGLEPKPTADAAVDTNE